MISTSFCTLTLDAAIKINPNLNDIDSISLQHEYPVGQVVKSVSNAPFPVILLDLEFEYSRSLAYEVTISSFATSYSKSRTAYAEVCLRSCQHDRRS